MRVSRAPASLPSWKRRTRSSSVSGPSTGGTLQGRRSGGLRDLDERELLRPRDPLRDQGARPLSDLDRDESRGALHAAPRLCEPHRRVLLRHDLLDALAGVADVLRPLEGQRALRGGRRSDIGELVRRERDRGCVDRPDPQENEDQEPDDGDLADESGFVAQQLHPRNLLRRALRRSSTSVTRRIRAEIRNTSIPATIAATSRAVWRGIDASVEIGQAATTASAATAERTAATAAFASVRPIARSSRLPSLARSTRNSSVAPTR